METINNEIEDVCGCDGLTPSLMDDISSHPNASSLKELYGYLADQYFVEIANILSCTNME